MMGRSWERLSIFFICGDINIDLKLELGDEDLQEVDGIDWYGTGAMGQTASEVARTWSHMKASCGGYSC